MRRLIVGLGLLILLVAVGDVSSAQAATYYRVNVTRVEKDLYRETSYGYFIVTRYCYEYAYGADAFLVWDGPYSFSNKLIFNPTFASSSCDVARVFR